MGRKALWERGYPYMLGACGAVVALAFHGRLLSASDLAGLDLQQLSNSMFSLIGLTTGLLFSVYILALAPGGGFFERIFSTRTFAVFRRYVIEAVAAGAIATALLIPLTATEVLPERVVWGSNYLTLAIASVVTASAHFFRVFHIFAVMLSASAKSGNKQR